HFLGRSGRFFHGFDGLRRLWRESPIASSPQFPAPPRRVFSPVLLTSASPIHLVERNRSAVGKTANSLVTARRQQLAPSGRARLLLEPRRYAVLISGLTTHGGGHRPFLAV